MKAKFVFENINMLKGISPEEEYDIKDKFIGRTVEYDTLNDRGFFVKARGKIVDIKKHGVWAYYLDNGAKVAVMNAKLIN